MQHSHWTVIPQLRTQWHSVSTRSGLRGWTLLWHSATAVLQACLMHIGTDHALLRVVCCQEEWPEMYWKALQDLHSGTARPVPTPHPKFSLEVRLSIEHHNWQLSMSARSRHTSLLRHIGSGLIQHERRVAALWPLHAYQSCLLFCQNRSKLRAFPLPVHSHTPLRSTLCPNAATSTMQTVQCCAALCKPCNCNCTVTVRHHADCSKLCCPVYGS
jgi:hypothetical protein